LSLSRLHACEPCKNDPQQIDNPLKRREVTRLVHDPVTPSLGAPNPRRFR
jgi:hypothetical protein